MFWYCILAVNPYEQARSTKGNVVPIYRSLTLSSFDYDIPLSIGPVHRFATAAVARASDEDLFGDDATRKFMARAQVALQIGNSLDALSSSNQSQVKEAETRLHELAGYYITRTQGKSFPLCETVAMSLRSASQSYAIKPNGPRITIH